MGLIYEHIHMYVYMLADDKILYYTLFLNS